MKYYIFYIILFVWFVEAHSQIDNNLQKIDSIQLRLMSSKLTDSISIAKEHYKIAELYRYSLISDSAYFYYNKAEKVFKRNNSKYELAITYYGIAVIQKDEKDYTGSEVTSIEALTLFEDLNESNNVNKYKAFIYNNLGIVFNELGEFEESVEYYNKALKLKENLKGDFEKSIGLTKNNLAYAYKNHGDYDVALKKYREILSNKKLINNHPDIYVLALGNYANTLYQSKQTKQLPELYLKALRICDSINDSYNSIIIHQHLAEYYNDRNIKDSAKYYAYKAKNISEQYNNDDLLKSLLLLSKIEEGDIAAKHLKDYVKLSDSLHKSERDKRDKFARIRFETKQVEQENIRIARQRMWLFITMVTLVITASLIYLIITQRNKNRELKFAQEQQETNEEIYNLMLSQQDNIEEARTLEKKRISEELHDGVLGRLFGTRLSLDSLNMGTNAEAIQTRSQYIAELKTIEDDIRKVSHELNTDFISGSSFIDIIKTLLETQTKAYGYEYEFKHSDDINWESATNKTKIHIYRIIQESLQNIYKHANATLVKISFEQKNNVFCLTISDNGSGFDVNKAKQGIGLKNINSRVDEIKGDLSIISEAKKGTTVTIKVKTD